MSKSTKKSTKKGNEWKSFIFFSLSYFGRRTEQMFCGTKKFFFVENKFSELHAKFLLNGSFSFDKEKNSFSTSVEGI